MVGAKSWRLVHNRAILLNNIMVVVQSITGTELKNTLVYKRFLEERDHILKNKWYLSEKEGKDVGFEKALLDWVCNHRGLWLNLKQ